MFSATTLWIIVIAGIVFLCYCAFLIATSPNVCDKCKFNCTKCPFENNEFSHLIQASIMQTDLNLQYDARILGYDADNIEKVRSVFKEMTADMRQKFKRDYEILLNNIKNKTPHAMPWMKESWEGGLKILNEVINEMDRTFVNMSVML